MLPADMLAIAPSQITGSQIMSMCTKNDADVQSTSMHASGMPPLLTWDHITSPAYAYKLSKHVSHVHNCKCLSSLRE